MKTEHRNNLLKLATYVEDNITDHQFDMSSYWSECGATGCLLGHSINAGLMEEDETLLTQKAMLLYSSDPRWNRLAYDYDKISLKLFGDLDEPVWDFLFSSNWWRRHEYDSTDRLDGIKRLRMFAADPEICDREEYDYVSLFKDRLEFWDNEKFVFTDKEPST